MNKSNNSHNCIYRIVWVDNMVWVNRLNDRVVYTSFEVANKIIGDLK